MSDDEKQFTSIDFNDFVLQYGFIHTIASPHFLPINKTTESGFKIEKQYCNRHIFFALPH